MGAIQLPEKSGMVQFSNSSPVLPSWNRLITVALHSIPTLNSRLEISATLKQTNAFFKLVGKASENSVHSRFTDQQTAHMMTVNMWP